MLTIKDTEVVDERTDAPLVDGCDTARCVVISNVPMTDEVAEREEFVRKFLR